VAFFHQRRPRGFDVLIDRIRDSLFRRLADWLESDWIRLAPVDQIHATLIGMEARLDHGELVNKNWEGGEADEPVCSMDLDGFARYMQQVELPIQLQFGGFSPSADNPYDPRPPFERSFTILPDGLIVVVGWPMLDGVIRPALLDFRKGAESFHIVHKYHKKEADRDNDAFLVLGVITPMPWDGRAGPRHGYEDFVAALSEAQEAIRESLRTAPAEVALRREHGCVVRYRSADLAGVPERDMLPWESVTAEGLRRLYRSQ
jgi:hypothetical protein